MPATPYADLPLYPDRNRTYQEAEVMPRVRAWASSDGSGDPNKIDFAKFRRAFMWYDSAAPNLIGSYKLKFADVVDGKLTAIWRGITVLAGVMQGARGGTTIPDADRAAVRGQIEKYYAKARGAFGDQSIQVPWRNKSAWHQIEDQGDTVATTVERRFTLLPVELRAGGASPKIGGYAAVFNKASQNLGGFIEVVRSTFFNKSRGDGWPDVMARYNHEDNMLLGTTAAGTLQLSLDDVGLNYDVIPPRSRADVVELVQRGDVRKSSFAFRVPSGGEEWGLSDQGFPQRSLLSGQLVDVAPVNAPAYFDTTAAMRSLAERFAADIDEVRSLADHNELRKFFIRTDGPTPVKPRAFGPAAAAALLARRADPWE